MLPPVSPTSCHFPGDEGNGRIVRFDSECALIPTVSSHKQRPTPTPQKKSYSLPLWRICSGSALEYDDIEEHQSLVEERSTSPPMLSRPSTSGPRYSSKSIRRVPSTGAIIKPCLVDRDSRPPGVSRNPQRRPSLPTNLPQSYAHKHCKMIPLRSCCTGCYTIVEQSSRDSYEVKLPSPRSSRFPRSASDGDSPSLREDFSTEQTVHMDGLHQSRRCINIRNPGSSIDTPLSLSTSPSPSSSPLLKTPVDADDDELFPLPSCAKIRTCSPKSSPVPSPCAISSSVDTSPSISKPYLRAPPSPQLLAAAKPMVRRSAVAAS